jgi:hypothetical protein
MTAPDIRSVVMASEVVIRRRLSAIFDVERFIKGFLKERPVFLLFLAKVKPERIHGAQQARARLKSFALCERPGLEGRVLGSKIKPKDHRVLPGRGIGGSTVGASIMLQQIKSSKEASETLRAV